MGILLGISCWEMAPEVDLSPRKKFYTTHHSFSDHLTGWDWDPDKDEPAVGGAISWRLLRGTWPWLSISTLLSLQDLWGVSRSSLSLPTFHCGHICGASFSAPHFQYSSFSWPTWGKVCEHSGLSPSLLNPPDGKNSVSNSLWNTFILALRYSMAWDELWPL